LPEYDGYCMKCKKTVNILDATVVITESKRGKTRMAKGQCPKCSTTVCKILGKA